MAHFQVNDRVERLGSPSDYVTGRTGIVREVDGDRARVHWTTEKNGQPIPNNGIRTWVNFRFLRQIYPQQANGRPDYLRQNEEINRLMTSISAKTTAFAKANQEGAGWYGDLGRIIEGLKELDDTFNPTA